MSKKVRKPRPGIRPPFTSISAGTAGLPPGSPVYIGRRDPTQAVLSLLRFDEDGYDEVYPESVDALLGALAEEKRTWVNVNGLSGGLVEELCSGLGIHPLVVEDILNVEHRPRVEAFDDYLFLITKMLSIHEDGSIEYEQVSFIVTASLVVTFQETPGDCFGPIRQRLASGAGRIRRSGADYLAYALLDVIVDNYFLVLERLGDSLDRLEIGATNPATSSAFVADLQDAKAQLLRLRRVLWPVRDSISALGRLEGRFLGPELQPFLRDLLENMVQAVEAVETYREHAASIHEVYLASISNRMNEVMKVLTIISTIFIPLTFLAGVYGMNFRHMPELELTWSYPLTLGVMITVACLMVLYFKRKKWF